MKFPPRYRNSKLKERRENTALFHYSHFQLNWTLDLPISCIYSWKLTNNDVWDNVLRKKKGKKSSTAHQNYNRASASQEIMLRFTSSLLHYISSTITSVGRHQTTLHSYAKCKAPVPTSKEGLMQLLLQPVGVLSFSRSKAREQWLSLKTLAPHKCYLVFMG